MKLGTLLLRNDVISLSQLENALRTQVLYGGKLGTNLVELGYIDLGTLAEYLAEILGVPLATQEMFESVSEDVISDFSAALARRYEAFPLGYLSEQPGSLAVAFANPRDPEALARLAEDVGSPIFAHVAPELRIYYYLEKHYGITRKARFVRVGSLVPVPESVGERRRMQPAGGIVTPPVVRVEPRSKAASKSTSTHGPGASRAAGASTSRAGSQPGKAPGARAGSERSAAPAGTEPPRSYREACAAVDQAANRDAIGDALIQYMRGRFEAAVVFLIRDGNALGWRLHNANPDRDTYPIEELSLPLGGISVLQTAYDSGQIYRGKSPSAGKPVERQLWEVLGTHPEPEEVVVVPIMVKQRAVNLLYVHAPGGGPIDDTSLKKLAELGKRAARSYTRLIQAAKVHQR